MNRILPVILSIAVCVGAFLTLSKQASALGCPLTITDSHGNPLPSLGNDFNDTITVRGTPNCFSGTGMWVIAYPSNLPLSQLYHVAVGGSIDVSGFAPTSRAQNITSDSLTAHVNVNPNIQEFEAPGYSSGRKLIALDLGTKAQGPLGYLLAPKGGTLKGSEKPGSWTIALCRADDYSDCTDPKYIVGSTQIQVTKTPSAITTATDLPTVEWKAQGICTFQAGASSNVPQGDANFMAIYRVTNLKPNTKYYWWWEGDTKMHNAFTSDDAGSPMQINNISADDTKTVGTRKLCIDTSDRVNKMVTINQIASNASFGIVGTIIGTPQSLTCSSNSILLDFTAAPPDPKISACTEGNAGDFNLPDPEHPQTVLPPCDRDHLVTKDKSGNPLLDVYGNPTARCTGVNTGLGITLATQPIDFVKSLLSVLLSISGGIMLLIIIATGYRFMTSQGDPEKLKGARETLTSAIVGLLFMIFSMVILQIIGVDILKIPGFH